MNNFNLAEYTIDELNEIASLCFKLSMKNKSAVNQDYYKAVIDMIKAKQDEQERNRHSIGLNACTNAQREILGLIIENEITSASLLSYHTQLSFMRMYNELKDLASLGFIKLNNDRIKLIYKFDPKCDDDHRHA